MEIGIACATFGLILASIMGGPIAKFLITRHKLTPDKAEKLDVGVSEEKSDKGIGAMDFLDAILAIHLSILLGLLLNEGLLKLGLKLPLFVPCLFAGIVITNLIPDNFPRSCEYFTKIHDCILLSIHAICDQGLVIRLLLPNSQMPISFPFDCCRRFTGDIINHPVNSFHFIYDPIRDAS